MNTLDTSPKGEVFDNAHFWIEWATFGHVTNAPTDCNGIPKNINAIDGNLTGGGGKKACKYAHGGGFTCAVGTKEPNNLAFEDIKGDSPHSEEITVILGKIFNMNHKASPSSQQQAGYQVANLFKINRS